MESHTLSARGGARNDSLVKPSKPQNGGSHIMDRPTRTVTRETKIVSVFTVEAASLDMLSSTLPSFLPVTHNRFLHCMRSWQVLVQVTLGQDSHIPMV